MNTDEHEIGKNKLLPTIKIGRFESKEKYSKKGLGTEFFGSIRYNLNELSKEKVGFTFVVIEGQDKAYLLHVKKIQFHKSKDK